MIKIPSWGYYVAAPIKKVLGASLTNSEVARHAAKSALSKIAPSFLKGDADTPFPSSDALQERFKENSPLPEDILKSFTHYFKNERTTRSLMVSLARHICLVSLEAVNRAIRYRPTSQQTAGVGALLGPYRRRLEYYKKAFEGDLAEGTSKDDLGFPILIAAYSDPVEMHKSLSQAAVIAADDPFISASDPNLGKTGGYEVLVTFAFLQEMMLLDDAFVMMAFDSNDPWAFDGLELALTLARENGRTKSGYQTLYSNSIHNDVGYLASGMISFNGDWLRDALTKFSSPNLPVEKDGSINWKKDSDLVRLVSLQPFFTQWCLAMGGMWRDSQRPARKLTSPLSAPFAPISSLPTRWFYWPQIGLLSRSFVDTEKYWNVGNISSLLGLDPTTVRSFLLGGAPEPFRFKYANITHGSPGCSALSLAQIKNSVLNLESPKIPSLTEFGIEIKTMDLVGIMMDAGKLPYPSIETYQGSFLRKNLFMLVDKKEDYNAILTLLQQSLKVEADKEVAGKKAFDLLDLIVHFK